MHTIPDKFDRADISNITEIKNRGISSGTMSFDHGGKSYYFKPIAGEKFTYLMFRLRDSVTRNDKVTGEPVNPSQLFRGGDPKRHKGLLADREHAASVLADYLNMDHVAPTKRMSVPGMGEGTVSMSVADMYKHKKMDIYDRVSYPLKFGSETHRDIANYDKNITDKAFFDHLMGNTDRHTGNWFVGVDKDGNRSMLAFDHGFSFPNDNNVYDRETHIAGAKTGIQTGVSSQQKF